MKPIKALEKYNELKLKREKIDEEMESLKIIAMQEMHRFGLKQIKTDDLTASVAKRVTLNINESEFKEWMSNQNDVEIDLFYVNQLDKDKVVKFGEKQLKETGEVVPFIHASETEYLSVRNNKK